MTTRVITTSMRHDDKIQGLSAHGLLLFFCLIDHILGHISGIFCIPKSAMAWGKLSLDETDEALRELIACELAEWDEKNEVVWLRSGAYIQCHEGKWGKLQITSISTQVNTLQYSPLAMRFVEYYESRYNLKLNGLGNRISNGLLRGMLNPTDTDKSSSSDKSSKSEGPPKKTRAKGKDNKPKIKDDFLTSILKNCSEVRYVYRGRTSINPYDGKNRTDASLIHLHVKEQFRLRGQELNTKTELAYIAKLYRHFITHEKHNLNDEDYVVDKNYPFVAFRIHLNEWIEAENREEKRARMTPEKEPEPESKPKYSDPKEARQKMDEILSGIAGKATEDEDEKTE